MSEIYDDSLNESAEQIKAFFASKIKIDKKANKIYIKGINYNKFLVRIKDMYDTRSVNNIFTKNYTVFTQKLWEQKKIRGNQRKMSNLEVDLFFAQELYNILMELADYYNMNYYKRMAKYIYDNTYLSNADKQPTVKVDMSILDRSLNEKYKPKDFQEEFIRKYFEYKEIYELDGYILSFDQGLGKTFTAACIAEIINPDQVIIICLNSLKENWANELRMYFKRYNNEETFKEEVYVHGISKQKYSDKTKYIIVNNESINKIFPLVKGTKSTMIVVDESQNFRNLDSLQTKNMLKLKEITKCKDNLIMSGTPIKANPSEIVPAMIMIDPTFTMDLARVYIKSFTSNVESLSNVVTPRFNKTVYRKTKDQVLNLPTKTVTNFQLKYRNEEPYLMRTVRNQINERFKEILASYKDEIDAVKDEFRQTTLKYSSQDRTTTLDYIKFVDNGQDYESIHDSLYDLYDGFLRQQVYPNIKDKKEYDRYKYVVSVYVYLTQKCFFLAMGEIMPKVKAQAFIELYDNNIDLIVKMIDNNPKKTVIFSTIVEVVEHIYDDLNKRDIKTVKITGKVKNRMDIINQFRNDDTIDVLVATSQTIGTGVTLVEASQMFIFGPPYRKADFDQACDRLHRIGQTHPVNIYNIVGACTAKDVTNRMTDILEWSDKMVSSVLDNITNEQTLLFEYCQFINDANKLIESGVYDMGIIYEEAVYDSTHTVPVFITLLRGHSPLSNIISKVTKAEYTHATISFTSTLNPMYSFGMKESLELMDLGFSIVHPKVQEFKNQKAAYSVYVMYVTKKEKQAMMTRLEWFKEKNKYLKYDFVGLVKYLFNVSSDNNLERWFCSRFVMELIGQTQKLPRDPSLYSPQQIADELENISIVNKGDDFYYYDYKVTEKNLKNIQKGIYNNIKESVEDMPIIHEEKDGPKGVEFDLMKNAKTPKEKLAIAATYGLVANAQNGNYKVSTTSTGADYIDSKLKSRIETFDKDKTKAILESEDIVKEYNLWIEADINRIVEAAKRKQLYNQEFRSGEAESSAISISKTMLQIGIDEKNIKEYLKGTFYYTNEDPEKIKKLLTLRLKYCQKIVDLLSEMIKVNYKILGFTEQEAEIIITALNSDNENTQNAIVLIKQRIDQNREKFITNNGECVDLTSLGFGKIFITKGSDILNSFLKAADNTAKQGGQFRPQNNADQAIDGLLQKAMTYDAIILCHGLSISDKGYKKVIDKTNTKRDKANRMDPAVREKKGIDTRYMQDYNTKGKTMASDNKTDKDYGSSEKRWMMQPIRSDRSNYYTDMNSFIKELLKEGYYKILIGACNPGSHKLDPSLIAEARKHGGYITYSNYSNLIESDVEYDLSDDLSIEVLNAENELMQLAESYDIDYDNINIDENTLLEPITEGAILDKIKEYAKRVLEFIIGLFKKLWKLIRKFLFFIGEKLGIVKNGQAEIKIPKIKGKLVFFENATTKDIEITNMQQLQAIAKQSCASIQKELSKRQAIQTKAAKQLNDFVQRMQDKHVKESTHFLSFLDEETEPLNDDQDREMGWIIDFDKSRDKIDDAKANLIVNAYVKLSGNKKMATTSLGKDVNDSVIQTRLEQFDQKMAKKILKSKDIVKAYNDWIDADLDAILSNVTYKSVKDKNGNKILMPEYKFDSSNSRNIINILNSAIVLSGGDKEQFREYLKGTFYYVTDDPEQIKALLQSRLEYSNKLITIFTDMVNNNMDILEITNKEAKNLIKRLNNDNTMNDSVKMIKELVFKNREKFITNDNECIDLTSIGGGKIFMTGIKTKNMLNMYQRSIDTDNKLDDIDASLDELFQKAMVYDAIVNCHGTTANELKYYKMTAKYEIRRAIAKFENDEERAKKYSDLVLINKPLDKNQYRSLFKTRWMMEPVRTDKSDYFIDMDSMVQELLKEGYKNILICACNPGHYALSIETRDMAKRCNAKVLYSDYSNLKESNYENEENLRIVAESVGIDYSIVSDGEKELKELCEEYNIDYNVISDKDIISEGIKDLSREALKSIVAIFKKAWESIKGFIRFTGSKLNTKNEEINTISIGLCVPDAREVQVYSIDSFNKLNNIANENCDSFEKEIKYIQGIQVNALKKLLSNNSKISESSLLSEDLNDFLGYRTVNEAVLSSKERKNLPDSEFGLPKQRKFPLNDYDHVIMAIKFFNRCDKKDQEELSKNILKAMKKYKVPYDKIGKNNKLRNYININESYINEGIGDIFKYKTVSKEIKPKVNRKDALYEVYKICNTILNKPQYNSIKKYVKKVNNSNEFKDYMSSSTKASISLYEYKVPNSAQGRKDLFGPKFNEKEDNDYDWVGEDFISKFISECDKEVSKISNINGKASYSIDTVDGEMYIGDITLFYTPQFEKIKVDKKTGKPVNESYPGNPVVGLNTEREMIVDNMYNNAFTSLDVDEKIIRNCITATTKALLNKEDKFYVPYIPYISESLNIDPNIGFYKDTNGIFVMNENNGLRSPSYKDVDDIDDRTILYITYGELNDAKMNDL